MAWQAHLCLLVAQMMNNIIKSGSPDMVLVSYLVPCFAGPGILLKACLLGATDNTAHAPCLRVRVSDLAPRFTWRGVSVGVCRLRGVMTTGRLLPRQ